MLGRANKTFWWLLGYTDVAPAEKPAINSGAKIPVAAPKTQSSLPTSTPTAANVQRDVDRYLEELNDWRQQAIDSKALWDKKKIALGGAGAIETSAVPSLDENDSGESLFQQLLTNTKDFCKSAQGYLKEELKKGIGLHLANLHKDLQDEIVKLHAEKDPAKRLQLELQMCDTMISLDIDRIQLTESVISEFNACLNTGKKVSDGLMIGLRILIQMVIHMPVPDVDFHFNEAYVDNLGKRVAPQMEEQEKFFDALTGTEQAALNEIGDVVAIPSAAPKNNSLPAPVKTKPSNSSPKLFFTPSTSPTTSPATGRNLLGEGPEVQPAALRLGRVGT